MNNTTHSLIKTLSLAERLKNELRHSWTSSGRQESVAEHSWRLALMVLLIQPHLKQPIDIEKALTMAIIHDLVEAKTGDTPVFDVNTPSEKASKRAQEQAAMRDIAALIGEPMGSHIAQLWNEFEDRHTFEARLIFALDKLECKIQHNEAELSTWNDKERALSFDWENALYDCDPFVLSLKDFIKETSEKKVQSLADMIE